MTDSNETVDRATEAWTRLKQYHSWNDWLLVGEAMLIGRDQCMYEAQANSISDGIYRLAFSKWLDGAGLGDMDKGVRSRLFKCMIHRADICTHLQTLTATKRMTLNHPNAVLRHWYNNSSEGRLLKEEEDSEKGGGTKRKVEKKKAEEDRSKWVMETLNEKLAKTGDWEFDRPETIFQKLESNYPSRLADIVALAISEKESHGFLDWEEDPEVVRTTLLATLPHTLAVNHLLRDIADQHSKMLIAMKITQ